MHIRPQRALAIGASVGLALPLALAATAPAGATARHTHKRHVATAKLVLREIAVKGYGDVVANATDRTLYVLSVEAGSKVVCKGACLKAWPPLLVPKSEAKVPLSPAVKGKIGFVARSKTTKQVTLNGYPLYTFVGDTKPGEANGEGIVHFGGTWYLVRPTATTPAMTRILPHKAAAKPTTSSSSGSGYGSGY